MDINNCLGCEDDFYNDKNPLGVTRCWLLEKAQVITRYRLGVQTRPTEHFAYAEVKKPQCYRQKGYVFHNSLPDFVKREDVFREKAAR